MISFKHHALAALMLATLAACASAPSPHPPARPGDSASPAPLPEGVAMRYRGRDVPAHMIQAVARLYGPASLDQPQAVLDRAALLYIASEQARADGLSIASEQLKRYLDDAQAHTDRAKAHVERMNTTIPPEHHLPLPSFAAEHGTDPAHYRAFAERLVLAQHALQARTNVTSIHAPGPVAGSILETPLVLPGHANGTDRAKTGLVALTGYPNAADFRLQDALPRVQADTLARFQENAARAADRATVELLVVRSDHLSPDLVTDAQARAFAKAHRAEITAELERRVTPRRVRLRRLLLKINPQNPQDSADRIAALLREARSGAAFEDLVDAHSEDIVYKDQGGLMGDLDAAPEDAWRNVEDLSRELREALDTHTRPGALFVASTSYAHVLYKLGAHRPRRVPRGAKARLDAARALAFKDRASTLTRQLAETLRAEAASAPERSLADLHAQRAERLGARLHTAEINRSGRHSVAFDPETRKIAIRQLPWTNLPHLGPSPKLAAWIFDQARPGDVAPAPVLRPASESRLEAFIVRVTHRNARDAQAYQKSLTDQVQLAHSQAYQRTACAQGAAAFFHCNGAALDPRLTAMIDAARRAGHLQTNPNALAPVLAPLRDLAPSPSPASDSP